MTHSISCGVVIYDEVDHIQKLIPKLKLELKNYDVEWIFILNHEQAEIRRWIKEWLSKEFKSLVCIENPSNNLGIARQTILESASNNFVYMTDPDIEINPGSILKLIQFAESDAVNDNNLKIIGFGGAVLHKSDNKFLQNTFNLMLKISKLFPFSFQIQNHTYLATVDHLPACHLLLKKNDAIRIGGFSYQLYKCGEDLEFTHRAYNMNYRFVFLPSSQVVHWQNMSTLRWILKIFSFGRIQIFAQKLNYKKGLRFYRFLPLFLLLFTITTSLISIKIFLFYICSLFVLFTFKPASIGFFITWLFYGLGELFELIWPIFEYRNEEKLLELKKDLENQIYEAKRNI